MMKRSVLHPWWRRALALLLLAVALPAGSARAETALASGYVNSTTLNMRPGPNTREAVVATLNRGDKVNVYEVNGVWLRIDVPSLGKSGYVSGKYITLNAGSGIYGFGVTSANVHVRSKNTAESESKGTVPSHTGLTLIKIESNGWWQVKTQDGALEGYIARKYVTVFCKAAKSSESGTTESAATISASGVNLRGGASTKNKSLGLLQKGAKVTVLATSGDWYKVKVTSSGKTGYVYKTFVKISGASSPTATPKASASDSSGTISASGVNLRDGASTKNKSLGLLQKGAKVTVLATSGDWYKVKVTSSGKTGYVYKTFVKISGASSPTPTPKVSSSTSAGVVNATNVNLRAGASTTSARLAKMAKNTAVSVLGTSGNWYQVRVDSLGKTGYVSKSYVTLAAAVTATPVPTATPTPAPTATPKPTATPAPTATPTPTATATTAA